MKNLKIFAVLFSVALIAGSCAKYDEGSNFSLISARQRLINTWELTKYEINNVDETANNPGLEVAFYKDDSFKRTFNFGFQLSDKGTWNFGAGKGTVILNLENGNVEAYKIIQLKNKDLKVERVDGSTTYRYTFKGK